MKLEGVLGGFLNTIPESVEFKLFIALKEFTLIAFSETITEEEANKLTELAKIILTEYQSLARSIKQNSDIFCKLHTLSHYGALAKRFGPLFQYNTMRYTSVI